MQARISTALQTTLDTLAQFGHMTLSAAQTSGFPVRSPQTFSTAHSTLDTNAQTARESLEFGLNCARNSLETGLLSARTGIAGARDIASSTIGNATRQVEIACRNAAIQLEQSGALSNETTERVISDLRSAGERMERAVEELSLGLQRRIDQHALQSVPAVEEDIYGVPLPGSFPAVSRVQECTDRLVELGYFGVENRDMAGAVSVAADGDLEKAMDIIDGKE
jgi:hypothetical protein